MTIRHLRIFKTVCETGGITKAAETLYMTQPAVSHSVRELEEELGTVLFERISRKITINAMGKIVLEKAERILELYEDLEQGNIGLEDQAMLRLGSSITIANFWLPGYVESFEKLKKNAPLEVVVDSAREITGKLLQNELDLALIEGLVSQEGLVKIPFSSYQLGAYCSPCHPFCKRENITVKELVKENLLLREKGSAIRNAFDGALLLRQLSANPFWVSANSQALIQAAKHNLGITVMPDILVKQELDKKELAQIHIEDLALENVNYIVYHKEKYLTASMKLLIDIVLKKTGK